MSGMTTMPTTIDSEVMKVDNSTSFFASATKPAVIDGMGAKSSMQSTMRTKWSSGIHQTASAKQVDRP